MVSIHYREDATILSIILKNLPDILDEATIIGSIMSKRMHLTHSLTNYTIETPELSNNQDLLLDESYTLLTNNSPLHILSYINVSKIM